MKKSFVSAIALGLCACACVGVVGLIGCTDKEEPKVDPYSTMSPISQNEFDACLNAASFHLQNKEVHYAQNVDNELVYQVDLQTYTENHNEIAHGKILVKGTKTYRGEFWLSDNVLYIDNGTSKYHVSYTGKQSGDDDELSENQVFQKYIYLCMAELDENSNISLTKQLLSGVKNDSVYYKSTSGNSKYYKMDFNMTEGADTSSGTFKFEFDSQNKLVDYSLEYVASSEGMPFASTKTTLGIKAATSSITLPSGYANWTTIE